MSEIELLNLMRDGAIKICEHAITQWESDKYLTNDQIRQNCLKEWKIKKDAIRPFINKIKKMIKENKI